MLSHQNVSVSVLGGPSVLRNFIPGRDGIFAKSRDPGIFRDGISLIILSRDFLEMVRDFSVLAILMQLVTNLEIFHNWLGFVYIRIHDICHFCSTDKIFGLIFAPHSAKTAYIVNLSCGAMTS